MWTPADQAGLCAELLALRHRFEIEECLGRCYGMRGHARDDTVEYTAAGIGGWVRVRYLNQEAVAVVFVAAGAVEAGT